MGILTSFIDSLPWPKRHWRVTHYVAEADLVPAKLPPRAIVLVGSDTQLKWIALDCPCGSGRVLLNASQRRPRWTVQTRAPATIFPSIDLRHDGHRCHYLVRRGRIQWVRGDRADEA